MADPLDPLTRLARRLVLTAGLAAAGSCADLDVVEPGAPVAVRVAPDTVILRIGATSQLRAAALDASSTLLVQKQAAWSSAAAGVASVDADGLVLAVGAGSALITATIDGEQGSAVAIVSGDPAALAIAAGDGQTAGVNESVPVAPTVRVTDVGGNPVYGVAVTFTVALGGGTIGATGPVMTDLDGRASTTWTLGPSAGTNTLTASVAEPGVTGTPATFTATATVGPPSATQSGILAMPASIPPSNGSSAATITVTVRDDLGRTVTGATVTLAASGTGNTLTQPAGVTNDAGQATGALSSTVAETKTITATVNGTLVLTQTATVTVTAGAPATIALVTAPAGAVSNALFTTQPVVEVRDAFGNRLLTSNDPITVSLVHGDGLLESGTGSLTTNAVNGRATFSGLRIRGPRAAGDTLGIGPHVLEFAMGGLAPVRSDTLPVEVSYGYNVVDVYTRGGCIACHGYTWATQVNVAVPGTGSCAGRIRVAPGDSTSIMYDKMKTLTPVCGGPMPPAALMSPRQQRIVRDWILQGARNN